MDAGGLCRRLEARSGALLGCVHCLGDVWEAIAGLWVGCVGLGALGGCYAHMGDAGEWKTRGTRGREEEGIVCGSLSQWEEWARI